MSYSYSIRILLNLKDENIQFDKEFCENILTKWKSSKAYYGKLTYTPEQMSKLRNEERGI